MYLSGFSTTSSLPETPNPSGAHTLPAAAPLKHQAGGVRQWDRGASRPAAGARRRERIKKEIEKETERGGRRRKIDCKKFERDLRDVSPLPPLLLSSLLLHRRFVEMRGLGNKCIGWMNAKIVPPTVVRDEFSGSSFLNPSCIRMHSTDTKRRKWRTPSLRRYALLPRTSFLTVLIAGLRN